MVSDTLEKPSLSKYSDVLKRFESFAQKMERVAGIDKQYADRLCCISSSIQTARESALRHRGEMLAFKDGEHKGKGTTHWQAVNVDPFKNATDQVRTLLAESSFVEQVKASTVVIPEGTNEEVMQQIHQDHKHVILQVGGLLKHDIDQLAEQEVQGGGHHLAHSRALGRYAIEFKKSPF